jgi:hypothetical protein
MSTLFLLLMLALAGFLYLISQKPDTFRLERSAVMKAPPDKVFAHLNNLKRWNEWSPWAKKDPAMSQTYSGPETGVGAAQAWNGNRTPRCVTSSILKSRWRAGILRKSN